MRTKRKLILLAASFAFLHFLGTLFFLFQSWIHNWAEAIEQVMSFPGRLAAGSVGGPFEKLQNTALMFANSVLWGLAFATVFSLVNWRPRDD